MIAFRLQLVGLFAVSLALWGAAADASGFAAQKPIVAGGHNFAGQSATFGYVTADASGAIGTTRYVQLVNGRAAIYNRTTNALISSGALAELAGVADSDCGTQHVIYPSVIWDPSTARFYFAVIPLITDDISCFEYTYKLIVGFSKTASPNSLADWCRYTVDSRSSYEEDDPRGFLRHAKLGDSSWFLIVGYEDDAGPALYAHAKPPAGTGCPPLSTFPRQKLSIAGGPAVFPVPANGIDPYGAGYVLARNKTLPSNQFWLYTITRNVSSGMPIFGPPRALRVASYDAPPDAEQPPFSGGGASPFLETGVASPSQAVLALNPTRGPQPSLWTAQTFRSGAFSGIRWYEINPVPATPVVRRAGTIVSNNASFLFNPSISPDRRVDGATRRFGDSFVIYYNASSRARNVNPGINAASSLHGGPLTFSLITAGVGPYRGFGCSTTLCPWSLRADASPDPRPATTDRGTVWGTSQFSGVINPPANRNNWRTEIFAAQP